jgi:hypothetical protein
MRRVALMELASGALTSEATTTQVAALVWMIAGLFIYFLYAKSHSKLETNAVVQAVSTN